MPRLFPILLLTLCAQLSVAESGEFVPLFNGRDLSGWVNVNCAPETWTVRDGMLHCDGVPTGALRTERQYENFVFEAEWRHLKPAGNAGIFVWSSPLPACGQPFLRAIEVQVLDHGYGQTENYTTHGDVFPIHGSTMSPFGRSSGQRSFPSESRSKPSPEWNQYRITCKDGTLRLAVNGKEVSGGSGCQWRKGYLALESEGGAVDWKNLRIQELPASEAPADQSAPLWDGSFSLYNGRNLEGWKIGEDSKTGDWTAADWELLTSGSGGPLVLERTLGEAFQFQLDVRCGEKAELPLPVLVNGQRLPGTVSGKWVRWIIRRNKGELWCTPEGAAATQPVKIASGAVEIRLQSTGSMRIANLFLKE